MGDSLTLQEAAERLDVHYMTAYRYVRLGQLPARKEGAVWRVSPADLHMFQQQKVSDPSIVVSRGNADWSGRLESRLIDGDESGAWRVVEGALAAGTEPIQVYTELLIPALRSIGSRWEQGQLTVAHEHIASAVAGRLIGRLGPRFARRGRRRGSVVVAAPSGDRHGLGLSMIADALRAGRYAVVDLGPDTPLESFKMTLEMVDRLRGVCVGVANLDALDAAVALVDAAREIVEGTVPVLLGGPVIVDDDHARVLGADSSAQVETVADVMASLRSGLQSHRQSLE